MDGYFGLPLLLYGEFQQQHKNIQEENQQSSIYFTTLQEFIYFI